MTRTLALALTAAAVFGTTTAASASHLCVTSNGQNVVCAPHLQDAIEPHEPICVSQGGRPIVCV